MLPEHDAPVRPVRPRSAIRVEAMVASFDMYGSTVLESFGRFASKGRNG